MHDSTRTTTTFFAKSADHAGPDRPPPSAAFCSGKTLTFESNFLVTTTNYCRQGTASVHNVLLELSLLTTSSNLQPVQGHEDETAGKNLDDLRKPPGYAAIRGLYLELEGFWK